MLKPFIYIGSLFSFLVVFSACPSSDVVMTPYPDCVQFHIDSILDMPILDPPGRIEQWQHGDDTYIYVSGGCCDFFNYLYTIDCEKVCAYDGGITGNGDGKCPDLTGEITMRTVWEDAP